MSLDLAYLEFVAGLPVYWRLAACLGLGHRPLYSGMNMLQ